MRRIIKDEPPEFWVRFLRKNPGILYKDIKDRDVLEKLHEYLVKEQQYLCCYCCKRIESDNIHNEHIKPQKTYGYLSTDYQNIVGSCQTKDTCGRQKSSKYEETLFVSPLDEDCENHFYYNPDGTVAGITKKGKYTVELLNLNSYKLVEARAAVFKACQEIITDCGAEVLKRYYIESQEGKLPIHVDMVQYFYNKGYFSIEAGNQIIDKK